MDSGPGSRGWRLRYNEVTDPRLGVVRNLRLIGVKRKPAQHGARDPQRTAPWVDSTSHENWAASPPLSGADNGAGSEAESEEEEEEDADRILRFARGPLCRDLHIFR